MKERQAEEGRIVTGYARWKDIRAEHVERAGGEEVVEAGKQELLAKVPGQPACQVRRSRGMTQQDIAQRMGVTKGRVSQIQQGGGSSRTGRSRPVRHCTRRSAPSVDLLRRWGHRSHCLRCGRDTEKSCGSGSHVSE